MLELKTLVAVTEKYEHMILINQRNYVRSPNNAMGCEDLCSPMSAIGILRQLRRRTAGITEFQQKCDSNADENERPDPMCVDADHPDFREQKYRPTDQKYRASNSAVESAIPKPVGEAADGHGKKACSRRRRMERTPIDSYQG